MQVTQATCENCNRSMIRDFHGRVTLYCGRFNRCLDADSIACDFWADEHNHKLQK